MPFDSVILDSQASSVGDEFAIDSHVATGLKSDHRVRTLRVLHVVNGEHYAGAERVQDWLALSLPKLGIDVAFACVKPNRFPIARRCQSTPLTPVPMRTALRLAGRLAFSSDGSCGAFRSDSHPYAANRPGWASCRPPCRSAARTSCARSHGQRSRAWVAKTDQRSCRKNKLVSRFGGRRRFAIGRAVHSRLGCARRSDSFSAQRCTW